MQILPFAHFILATNLNPRKVLKRLAENVEPYDENARVAVVRGRYLKPYLGSIGDKTFRIHSSKTNDNSSLINISGKVEYHLDGSKIFVKMMPPLYITIFLLFWFGVVGLGCLLSLAINLSRETFQILTIIPFGMFLIGYNVIIRGYNQEITKTKLFLFELFEVEIK